MKQFLSIFSSTTLNFMFSRDPLFNLFLFSLFRYFLNSFFLFRDSPLSPNRVPHFLVMISLYSLFSFSIILLLHLLLPVAIFNFLSLYFLFYFIFIYLGTMADLLFGSPPSLIFFTLFSQVIEDQLTSSSSPHVNYFCVIHIYIYIYLFFNYATFLQTITRLASSY